MPAIQTSGTGYLDANSPLVRQGWVKEGLIQNAARSWWAPYTGNSGESVVYQRNMTGVAEGNLMNFDYDGNLVREMTLGREQLFGTGVEKKKFSSKLMIYDARLSVDNGTRFKNKAIGDLSIGEHGDSLRKLADLWVRHKDQAHFDAVQGRLNGIGNSHIFRPNKRASIGALLATDVMTYDFLLEISELLREGEGFAKGNKRLPLKPFSMKNGEIVWHLILDNAAFYQLKRDKRFQDLLSQADLRGENNMLFKGAPLQIGSLVLVTAPVFFGSSTSRKLGKVSPQIAGLRKIDETGKYTGEDGFGEKGKVIAARSILVGAGALQYGMGQAPDYNLEFSKDHKKTSESALEVYFNVQKTQLIPETDDYEVAKVGNMDYGVIAVDTYVKVVQ